MKATNKHTEIYNTSDNHSRKTSAIVETCQLIFRLFIYAFLPEIPSFFSVRVSSVFSYLCVIRTSVLSLSPQPLYSNFNRIIIWKHLKTYAYFKGKQTYNLCLVKTIISDHKRITWTWTEIGIDLEVRSSNPGSCSIFSILIWCNIRITKISSLFLLNNLIWILSWSLKRRS